MPPVGLGLEGRSRIVAFHESVANAGILDVKTKLP